MCNKNKCDCCNCSCNQKSRHNNNNDVGFNLPAFIIAVLFAGVIATNYPIRSANVEYVPNNVIQK